jgi:hypothetical protein
MISITPLSGFRNTTQFSFQISPSSDSSLINWGDNTFSYTSTATHIYSSLGLFEVFGGTCSSTSSFFVSVYDGNFFTDKIVVQSSAPSAVVSCPFTFTINLSSKDQINTVLLYASGSKSSPYNQDRNFWSHLNPEWEFSFQGNKVSEITLTGSPVYSGNHILGYSSCSSVSFLDDMPGNINLFFTVIKKEQNIPVNSRVYSCLSHSVCAVTPDKFFITSDGINSLNAIQWCDKNVPFVISAGSSQNSCTNILHYVSAQIIDVKLISNCYNLTAEDYSFSTADLKNYDKACFESHAYFLSSFFYPSSNLPPIVYQNNLNQCGQNYDKIEFTQNRNVPQKVAISATGMYFTSAVASVEVVQLRFTPDLTINNLSGKYVDFYYNYENNDEIVYETARFWFEPRTIFGGYIPVTPPETPDPGILIPVSIYEGYNNLDITSSFYSVINGSPLWYIHLYIDGGVQGDDDTYYFDVYWVREGVIDDPYTNSNVQIDVLNQGSDSFISNTITGQSDYFDILAFENRHDFYRKGEDYTVYDILKKSLPFDVTQLDNFNSYLSSIAGQEDSLGKIYDKIYNFNKDHSDVEVCTFDNLIKKSNMLDFEMDDFGLELPEELKRLFNFSTIPLQKLIGTRCSCNNNFVDCNNCYATNICGICKFDKRTNLGSVIKQNDYVSAGEVILYKEIGGEIYNFLPVKKQNSNVFQLKELSSLPINYGDPTSYCFYRWDQTPQNNPVHSVINYNDQRNKLNPSLSSNDDWYSDNGIIDEMFNFVLNKYLIN